MRLVLGWKKAGQSKPEFYSNEDMADELVSQLVKLIDRKK
jgi:hypothetical protein